MSNCFVGHNKNAELDRPEEIQESCSRKRIVGISILVISALAMIASKLVTAILDGAN